jgi:predicted nucleic acid-binding protein
VLVVLPDGALWDAALGAAAARSLRGADAVYVALADLLDLPLVTWDREQRERAGRRVRVITPAR